MKRRSENQNSVPHPSGETRELPSAGGGSGAARRYGSRSRSAQNVSDLITGEVLGHESVRKWFPLAAWCILLVFLYIGHVFDFQRLQRIEIARQLSLHEQRSRAMVFFSKKMNAVRHSNIVREIERRGIPLHEGDEPPAVAR